MVNSPRLLSALLALDLMAVSAYAQQPAPAVNPYVAPSTGVPRIQAPGPATNPYLMPGTNLPNPIAYVGLLAWVNAMKSPPQAKPYQMAPIITKPQKATLMQAMVPFLGSMSIRDLMNFMAIKYKAKEGLSYDDVVESMQLRANQLNFKLVGHSPMWKDFMAVLGDEAAPRVEVFHYCDIAAGREVLKLSPEAVAYLPCRIAVMEDADKNIWLITLDWDMAWLNTIQGSLGVNPELAKHAIDIRDKMDNIMQAAANGEL
jgi:uncharacterized protein (DUF302 family)